MYRERVTVPGQPGGLWWSQPRRQGLKRVTAPDAEMSRVPPQRRKARGAKRRCALQPGVFWPGCTER
ncbi:hypothetical protein AB9E53_21920, partial [Escherichia coli]